MQNKDDKLTTKCRFCNIEMEDHIQHSCSGMVEYRQREADKAELNYKPTPAEFARPDNVGNMTRRDWLAGLAMQGLLADGASAKHTFESIVEDAYDYAEAMIAEGEL